MIKPKIRNIDLHEFFQLRLELDAFPDIDDSNIFFTSKLMHKSFINCDRPSKLDKKLHNSGFEVVSEHTSTLSGLLKE